MTFKECYPYFKIPDLGALDGWVLGVYDTCSYIREDGHPSFGICCSNLNPFVTPQPHPDCDDPTVDDPDIEVRLCVEADLLAHGPTQFRWEFSGTRARAFLSPFAIITFAYRELVKLHVIRIKVR